MSITRKFDSNTTIFVPCNCKNEILTIEYDHTLNIADLAIYSSHLSFSRTLSLWQKIKYAFAVLFGKNIHSDQITLDSSQLTELKKFLHTIDV